MPEDLTVVCPQCGNPDARRLPHDSAHCARCFKSWRPSQVAPQIDIFGAEHAPEPEPPAYCRPAGKTEQPRLFEPQLAGQLDLNPEERADGAER